MKFFLRLKELPRDGDGQVLILILSILFILVLFWTTIPNVTKVVTTKMRVQTAVDIGAYSSSVWIARGMNLIAFCNIGIGDAYIMQKFYRSLYSSLSILWTLATAFPEALGWLHPWVDYVMSVIFSDEDFPTLKEIYTPAQAYEGLDKDLKNIAHTAELLQEIAKGIGNTIPGWALEASREIINKNTPNLPGRLGFAMMLPDIVKIDLEEDESDKLDKYIKKNLGPLLIILAPLEAIAQAVEWVVDLFDGGVKYVKKITVRQWYRKWVDNPNPPPAGHYEYYSGNPVTMVFEAIEDPQNPPENPINEQTKSYYEGDPPMRLPNAPSEDYELYKWRADKEYKEYKPEQPEDPEENPKPMKPDNYTFCTFAFVYYPPPAPLLGKSQRVFGDSPGVIPGLAIAQALPYLDINAPDFQQPIDSIFGIKWDARMDSISTNNPLLNKITEYLPGIDIKKLKDWVLLH
ncbi:MAG: hypothetical protein ABIL18_05990 [candidate division WOR-3 bacterium]